MSDRSGVYVIQRIDNGDCYIGSSKAISHRWWGHRRSLEQGVHHSPRLQRAWAKHGCDAFEFRVLEECEPEKAVLCGREQEYIDAFKPVYNVNKRADSRLGTSFTPEQKAALSAKRMGRKHSPETRAKMSVAAMGNQRGKGHAMSAENRAKISAANKGKPSPFKGVPRSDQTKLKCSLAQKGKARPWQAGSKRSPETRAKMSEAARNRAPQGKASEETRAKMRAAHAARLQGANGDAYRARLTESQRQRRAKEKAID